MRAKQHNFFGGSFLGSNQTLKKKEKKQKKKRVSFTEKTIKAFILLTFSLPRTKLKDGWAQFKKKAIKIILVCN